MATKSEKAANIAVILACGVFSTVYGMDLYHRLWPVGPNLPYKAGETIRDTADLSLSRARMTMVLVTRSGCHFCAASMPFYRRMADVAKRSGVRGS